MISKSTLPFTGVRTFHMKEHAQELKIFLNTGEPRIYNNFLYNIFVYIPIYLNKEGSSKIINITNPEAGVLC